MTLVRWKPFSEIERLVGDDFPFMSTKDIGWDLAVDLYEDKKNVTAEMNLPGIDPKKLEISVEDSHLRITGAREEEKETKEKDYYSKEIRRGSFERTVRLPSKVQNNKAKADYKKGVLKVTIPKTKEKEGKVKVNISET